jgi:hypothetical protein
MAIVNERVEHTIFGFGVITKVENNKIWVQFQEDIGSKVFLYPEAFEKFLKAVDATVESNILEEFHRKQAQIEEQRKEKERAAAKLEEEKPKPEPVKRKAAPRSTKKKASN